MGNSVAELAEKMGIDPAALCETVDNYNDMCDANYDEEFGKPRPYLNAMLNAMRGKHFYAYRVSVSAYGSLGGIKVNFDYVVMGKDGNVMRGLYSAGSDSCEIYNGTYYYFPGNSMGYAINSGRIAGENAADYALGEQIWVLSH